MADKAPTPARGTGYKPTHITADLMTELLKRVSTTKIGQQVAQSDGMVPGDEPYLQQFFGKPVLQEQKLRPIKPPKDSSGAWYKPLLPPMAEQYIDAKTIDNLPIGGVAAIDTMPSSVVLGVNEGTFVNTPGLGHVKMSVGKNEQGPYMSMYDKYDFKSPIIHELLGRMMDKIGTPYHVYDRYPLKREGNQYIWKAD